MLHAKRYHEEAMDEQSKNKKQLTMRFEEAKDSGYITANTLSTTDSAERRRSSFSTLAKAVQSTQRLARFRRYGATFAFRSKSEGTAENKKEQSEKGKQGTEENRNSSKERNSERKKRTTDQWGKRAEKGEEEEEDEALLNRNGDEDEQRERAQRERQKEKNECECSDEPFDSVAFASLSTDAFNDESLSSVLHFSPSPIVSPFADPSTSDTTSQIIANRKAMDENEATTEGGGCAPKFVRNASSLNSAGCRRNGKNGRNSGKKTTKSLRECHRRGSKSPPISAPLAPKALDGENKQPIEKEDKNQLPNDQNNEQRSENGAKETGEMARQRPMPSQTQQTDHPPSVPSVALTMGQVSRTLLQKPSEQRQANANGAGEGDEGMLGRFFNRIHSWVRVSMIGIGGLDSERTGGESSGETRPDLMYGLPSFLHSSRSYSSMSSASSQDASRRTSLLPVHGQVPLLTVTRESLWDGAAGDGVQPTAGGMGRAEETADAPRSAHMSFAENGARGRKPSRLLHSVFAPISALHRHRKRTKAERRALKAFRTITFIVGLFAILWSPYYVVATIYGFCRGQCIPSLLYNVSYYMCYLNSSLNPFAYALANRQFRLAFVRILRGNLRQL